MVRSGTWLFYFPFRSDLLNSPQTELVALGANADLWLHGTDFLVRNLFVDLDTYEAYTAKPVFQPPTAMVH